MAKPITIPNTFANATTSIPLSQLDNNYSTITSSINDANTYSNYAADSGGVNAYAVTLTGVSTTYTAGLRIQFKAANSNSGASTLNVNSQGAQAIKLTDGSALPANSIIAGAIVDAMYDGTNFQLLSDSNGGQQVITNLSVTGNLTVAGTSGFTGNVTANVANVTTMSGNPTFSGNVVVQGTTTNVANLNASGNVAVTGNATITGTSSFTGNVSANTVSVTSLSDSGNLTFTGTGNRITGDFSNATIANRVLFQTSTTNSSSVVGVLPNGTGTITQFAAYGGSDPANAQVFRFDNRGGSESRIESTYAGTPTSGTYLPMTFLTGGSERMRIDSSGNLLVGTTSTTNNSRLKVQGSSTSSADYMVQFTDSAGANAIYIKNDRSVFSDGIYNSTTASAANVFINGSAQLQRSTSSLKYKTDVHDATHGLAEVMQLRPVTYKGKNDGDTVFGGLIAEEVDAAGLTEFVQYADDGTPDALAYGNMVSLCIKAIQELKAELDATKAEVAALKGA